MTWTSDESWFWRSWVETTNDPDCGFPLQNLPFCAFEADDGATHLGVGIGDRILDLRECIGTGLLSLADSLLDACRSPTLNALMGFGKDGLVLVRSALMHPLRDDAGATMIARIRPLLRPMRDAAFRMPVKIGNYTDFYASIHHATNVGRLFRPDQPLLPNYKFVPIGYHGRASSIVLSGTSIVRPKGQIKPPSEITPTFAPSRQLDFELEIGAYISTGNPLGVPVKITGADDEIWGVSLLNDWSARDIQAWEYQPLGPFLGKSFATSVSPWVVTREALAPFRTALSPRAAGDPEPLPYLRSPRAESDGIDVELKVCLATAAMRERSMSPMRLSRANLRDLYWTFAQMVAHHTSNGCNLQSGDLLASGTVSGAAQDELGSLLEITRRGAVPITLPTGETRTFLEDGDQIILTGECRREGLPLITLGECSGIVAPARWS